MKITIPKMCLVVMVGVSGSGKSTFARKHFLATEVISSDHCRGLVSDDENDQAATKDAFDVLNFIASKRLKAGKLTVIDATNVDPESRKSHLQLAREHHVLAVAIVVNTDEKICYERNASRPDRQFGNHVIRNQQQRLRRSLRGLEREGFRYVYRLDSPETVEAVIVERQPLWNDKTDDHGPFDIIGGIHGCYDELLELLQSLDYRVEDHSSNGNHELEITPPPGRKAIFLGDLVDRGPKSPQVLRLVMQMVAQGSGLCVPGNHDVKLLKKLKGRDVRIAHGLAETLEQLTHETEEFKKEAASFIDGLISHFVLDDGKLVVAHAGLKESFQGRGSAAVRDFALYGETTGETDDYGLPVRYNWASDYRGKAMVVYGHTPVPTSEWLNNTICIDNGCVFGGKLSALRYPEKQIVSVTARQMYYEPVKPLTAPAPASFPTLLEHSEVLNISDVIGKRIINTRLRDNITVREENAAAALEVMSRFAINPQWLAYLPPTMSPCETARDGRFLEHPAQAFQYFKRTGVTTVICEEKHMGSRAVVVVCRNEVTAHRKFAIRDEGIGVCYTRTGRSFFSDRELEHNFLTRVGAALDSSNFWHAFNTDWVILDCELMPWSAKARQLLQSQYASVGCAANSSLEAAKIQIQKAQQRGLACDSLLDTVEERLGQSQKFVRAYQQYCWPVNSLDDYKLAPFHILATENTVHVDKPHTWHMSEIDKLVACDGKLFAPTSCKIIDTGDEEQIASGIEWWTNLTSNGGEGMVVKPIAFIQKGNEGLVQPAIKCRGPEYLRIIYGPEYDSPANLARLQSRALAGKRSLAMREFALGVEGLERFVRNEPLYRVHECVFAVLALESEPIDPRL